MVTEGGDRNYFVVGYIVNNKKKAHHIYIILYILRERYYKICM